MTRRLGLIALILSLAAPATGGAQDVGTTSATVLRFAPAPRALALGGAYAALADALSVFYNPARLAAAAPALGLAYRTVPVEAGVGSAVLALPLGPGTLGGGVQFLNYGDIAVVEPDPASGGEQGIPTGERVGGGELAVTAAYGVRVGRFQLGAAAKLLRLQLAEAAATGTAYDLGLGADFFGGAVALGAAVQNLGAKLGPARAAPLPRLVRAGAALRLPGLAGLRGTLVAEAVGRDGEISPATGLELGVTAPRGAVLVGRVGYDGLGGVGRRPDPLVAGAGLTLDGISLDYAYRPLGPLGTTHIFGLSLRLGPRD